MPQALGRDIRGDEKNFWIGSNKRDGKLITQNGTFDRFLCSSHEETMHGYENYAVKFIREFSFSPEEIRSKKFVRLNVDNDALVKFVCSMLWKYHTSSRRETSSVKVGPWEPLLRQVTFEDDLANAPHVAIMGFINPLLPLSRFAYPPTTSRFATRRVWTFVTNGLAFMTKLDKQAWPPPLDQAVINGGDKIESVIKEMSRQDLADMRAITDRMTAVR